ncbi:MAG TPA: prolipoprotein diacylglyceryl transferase family protein, partial [Vicinamibacterales bacterium]|nr:prolipoprotein diacylglyceryl transferase family protein [Vicinamibacterales bacterium]
MHPILYNLPWKVPSLGTITIYTYGVLLAAAYLLGLQLALRRAKARQLDSARVMDLGIYIIISALVGAKLLLLVTDFQTFKSNPAELLNLLREGGVFYGGLIVAVTVALWYIKRVGLPLWTTCDVFAPGIALGHVIGRFGCFFAGCCFGKPTTVPWAITF